MMTKQEAALEFLEELKEIPRSKPQLMAYASKYAQDMLRNQEPMDRISAKMRSMAFIYFLGGSLRAALVNFTQNYVTGIPFLAREVGAKSLKAEKLYHKAMFDVATGKNLSEVEKKMLDEMINKGVAEDQFIRQINREVKGAVGQVDREGGRYPLEAFLLDGKTKPEIGGPGHVPGENISISSNEDTDTSEEAYRKAFDGRPGFRLQDPLPHDQGESALHGGRRRRGRPIPENGLHLPAVHPQLPSEPASFVQGGGREAGPRCHGPVPGLCRPPGRDPRDPLPR